MNICSMEKVENESKNCRQKKIKVQKLFGRERKNFHRDRISILSPEKKLNFINYVLYIVSCRGLVQLVGAVGGLPKYPLGFKACKSFFHL